MTTDEEYNNRERKFSTAGGDDVRQFSTPKSGGKLDPYYQRKAVPETMIKDVGYTGLTKEEEYLNRERKYSTNGADVRRFSNVKGDPYYDRKPLHSSFTDFFSRIEDANTLHRDPNRGCRRNRHVTRRRV